MSITERRAVGWNDWADGGVVRIKLPDEELSNFEGFIGHYHIQSNKVDPGPAFQWDFLVEQVASLLKVED
eukprot:489950-Pyramimonas_sp.AAC.1